MTTRLPGIPPEYFEYVFAADDNDVSLLSNALAEALKLTDDVLEEKGKCARRFIVEHKNALVQSRRVIDFCRQL